MLLRRLIAYCIDWYILYFLMNVILVVGYYVIEGKIITNLVPIQIFDGYIQAFLLIILCILFLAYSCVLPLFWNGQTLGKRIGKIAIYSDKKITLTKLFIRNFVGFVLLEGCFSPLSNYIRNILMELVGREITQYLVYLSVAIGVVSIGCMFLTPKKTMLHDLLANTRISKI